MENNENLIDEQEMIEEISKEIKEYQYKLGNEDEMLADFMIQELIKTVNKCRRTMLCMNKGRIDFYTKSQENIFYMTHIRNLPSMIEHGLLSHNLAHKLPDNKPEDISNKDVNSRRNTPEPWYGRNIHDYVPFYWNPRNAMLYSTQSRFSDNIIILGFELKKFLKFLLKEKPNQFLFTDKNAACDNTSFSPYFKYLIDSEGIDFKGIFNRNWYNNYDIEQKMMAEVLVYERVPFDLVTDIYIQTPEISEQVKTIFTEKNAVRPRCFYGNPSDRWSYFFNTKIDFNR